MTKKGSTAESAPVPVVSNGRSDGSGDALRGAKRAHEEFQLEEDCSPCSGVGKKIKPGNYNISTLVALITDMNENIKSMGMKVDKVEHGQKQLLTEMQDSIRRLTNDVQHNRNGIDELRADVRNSESKVAGFEEKLSQFQKQNDRIEVEIRRINLIVSGIGDSASQNPIELEAEVSSIFRNITGRTITFSKIVRIGSFKVDKTRLVKVCFRDITDRDMVYLNRQKTVPPVYINEDLPQSIQKANGILRRKSRQLRIEGVDNVILFSRRCIETREKFLQLEESGNFREISKPAGQTHHASSQQGSRDVEGMEVVNFVNNLGNPQASVK